MNHSVGYNPLTHNTTEIERYAPLYSDVYATSDVALYSYSGKGYNIAVISISEVYGENDEYALDEIVNFTVELNKVLESKGIN